jgi:translation initiation factor 4A
MDNWSDVVNINNEEDKYIKSFDDLNLKENLLRGIYAYGFEKPSCIQQKGIHPVIKGKDVIEQAQSGTGKTATFSIGLLQRLDENNNNIQAIVLAPTRELALQIHTVIRNISNFMNITTLCLIGGSNVKDCIESIKNGAHIIVGTPGRVYDMLYRKIINPLYINMLILDEADEILSYGFKDQIYNIFQCLNANIQVCLFSATMSPEIYDLTKNFMNNPYKIIVKNDELTLDGIKQFYVYVEKDNLKYDTLCDLFNIISISQSIIYCNTIKRVDWLYDRMCADNFTVSKIHGEMTQDERNIVMNEFRSGTSRVLIASDIISRGIDIQQVSVVVNYDIINTKKNLSSYIHKIGRCGRHGRRGFAINFVTQKDSNSIKDIEKYYSTQINELPADIADLINN